MTREADDMREKAIVSSVTEDLKHIENKRILISRLGLC